jgi:transcription-repair coupling factor (superfamily II helicase)
MPITLPNIKFNLITGAVSDSATFALATHLRDIANNVVYVVGDNQDVVKKSEQLRTLTANLGVEVIEIPGWEIAPYDVISPSTAISSERANGLYLLNELYNTPKIVVTTVSSLLQYLPPREVIKSASLNIKSGQAIDRNLLLNFLVNNGFNRVSTVTEPGEFAVRGSVIDFFSPLSEKGHRLDFFGDKVDAIREFDPITQISFNKLPSINIIPAHEILLTPERIECFKNNYSVEIGSKVVSEPMYEAILAGRKYPGIENWLPLFYETIGSLFDYVLNPSLIFDYSTYDQLVEYLNSVEDYYKARKENSSLFTPLSPEKLWLSLQALANYPLWQITPFNASEATISLGYKVARDLASQASNEHKSVFELLKRERGGGKKLIISCLSAGSRDRIHSMLDSHEIHSVNVDNWQEDVKKVSGKTVGLLVASFESGFIADNFYIITEQDLLGERIYRKKRNKGKLENFLSEAASLELGELVVHRDHGIGKFEGLETLVVSGISHDCLRIIYDGGDRLFIPVENIELISRYGSEEGALDRLGGVAWQGRKAKLKERIRDIAHKLLAVAASRELEYAPVMTPTDGLYDEFCAHFPYAETEDQLSAIEDVQGDMASGRAMDRLICGDVGFGKTEVAMRAAFIATQAIVGDARKQVAVVVPTTLLARQHYNNFIKRFNMMPGIKIAQLSRMVPSKEIKLVKERIANGEVDIVIGTHALLSKDVKFANLALLIIDEEQHFGVEQKEKLKKLKHNVHVLTLSATPIPRTLQMSLTGIKELSLITTPPVDRLAVKTVIAPFDQLMLREAIMREYQRGGKVFYVCPRIGDLAKAEEVLRSVVPEIKVITAHGQMSPGTLDEIMNDFYDGKYDLLLSTTIVESGLDVPSANTIIINNADKLGLAQLYQLRGRVGRGKIKAYAYLFVSHDKLLTKPATKRLEVMSSLDSLGAGFTLASHDMDIRGFGNILGDEQSGHIKEVGIELYQDMLREAIESLKSAGANEEVTTFNNDWSPQINIGLPVLIPEQYVPDLSLRLGLYKRVGSLRNDNEVESFAAELIDRFGAMPVEVHNLIEIVKLKILAKQAMVDKIDLGPKGVVFSFVESANNMNSSDHIVEFCLKNPHRAKLRPDNKIVFFLHEQTKDHIEFIKQAIRVVLFKA